MIATTPFVITTVCTGNICRSPLAESLLLKRLAMPGLHIQSAGSAAQVGAAVPDTALAVAKKLGLDLSRHVARALDDDIVNRSGLVLGLAREHRRAAVIRNPRASRYTFTLVEFARLTTCVTDGDLDVVREIEKTDVAGRMSAVTSLMASRRGHLSIPAYDRLDIHDPFGGSARAYESSAAATASSCTTVSDFVLHAISV